VVQPVNQVNNTNNNGPGARHMGERKKGTNNMKYELTVKRGALWTASVGLAGFVSKILTGAAALLLITGSVGGRAWAITGGQTDTNNTYSNVGAFVPVPPDGSPPFVAFSGTLIHPRVMLTAGHCSDILVQNPSAIPLCRVSFGKCALDPTTWREIEAVITHPNYTPLTPNGNARPTVNDVGVIILKEPIYDVPLASLPVAGFVDDLNKAKLLRQPGQGGVPFRVAGYGSTLEWPPPVIPPIDGWRRFADSEYLNILPEWLLLHNAATGSGGTGYGDSGGPAFWIAPDGTRVLVGITSWGDPNLLNIGFYWRVDVPETLDFINWVIHTAVPSLR
jgi:Trypsin